MDIVEEMFKASNTLKDIINNRSGQEPKPNAFLLARDYATIFKNEVINSIKEAINKGNEENLKHDGYIFADLEHFQESLKSNFAVNCLRWGKAISLDIIEKQNIPSTYKETYNYACEAIKYELIELQQETGCSKETLYHATVLLYSSTSYELYKIYHSEEFNNYNIRKNTNLSMLRVLTDKLNETTNKETAAIISEQIKEIEDDIFSLNQEFVNKWYDAEKLNSLSSQTLKEVYSTDDDIMKNQNRLLEIPRTCYPKQYIIPKDKVSNMLFSGKLSQDLSPLKLRMERLGSKKELTAIVSINFEDLEGVEINKEITPNDWHVHNSIVSLYIDGGNEYITPLMIYRTMTGNPNAELTPNRKESILESVARCSGIKIRIDSTEEAKAWGMDRLIYEGNLLYIEKVIGEYNGRVDEWFHIIRRPILYDYANAKNQVARMDIKLLNTPINKNDETLTLQGYLQNRILSMKGPNVSRNIKYETIYKKLNINAATPGALRKKQTKIRDATKTILEFWKENDFIKDFKENTGPKNSKVSITIIL